MKTRLPPFESIKLSMKVEAKMRLRTKEKRRWIVPIQLASMVIWCFFIPVHSHEVYSLYSFSIKVDCLLGYLSSKLSNSFYHIDIIQLFAFFSRIFSLCIKAELHSHDCWSIVVPYNSTILLKSKRRCHFVRLKLSLYFDEIYHQIESSLHLAGTRQGIIVPRTLLLR